MIKTSLLLLVFNGENYLNRALDSVYKQTMKLDEVIIINDASEDQTINILKKWSHKLPIKIINNKKNIGTYASLRKGIINCSGDLIFRIDHDDQWSHDHVEEIIKLYLEDKNAKLFATKSIYLDKDLNFMKYSSYVSDENIRKILLWDNPIVQSSTAFFKKDFIHLSRSNDLYSSEDYDLWIRLLNIGKLKFCNKATVRYFVYKNSLSRRNIKRSLSERFNCQKLALRIYFKKYPIYASLVAIILILRLLIFQLINFLKKNF
tara:strand:- start:18217 stop:19002 length:786 start_codon:yes stop_codon:yes gene_type:complete